MKLLGVWEGDGPRNMKEVLSEELGGFCLRQ